MSYYCVWLSYGTSVVKSKGERRGWPHLLREGGKTTKILRIPETDNVRYTQQRRWHHPQRDRSLTHSYYMSDQLLTVNKTARARFCFEASAIKFFPSRSDKLYSNRYHATMQPPIFPDFSVSCITVLYHLSAS